MTQEDYDGIKAYLRLMALFARHKILYPYILPSDDDDVIHYYIYKPANELADLCDSMISDTLVFNTNVKERIKTLSNQIWYACNQRTEANLFPRDSIEFDNNEPLKTVCNYLSFSPDKLNIDTISTIAGNMELRIDKVSVDSSTEKSEMKEEKKMKNVFIVHGHDENMIKDVAYFLSIDLKLDVNLLKDLPDNGNTIIEKLERVAQGIDYCIVLLSPDDFGGGKTEKGKETKDRARQNVIFEWGYFVAKLGRRRVCALLKDDVEIPSDLSGVLWKSYGINWKHELRKELDSAGITN